MRNFVKCFSALIDRTMGYFFPLYTANLADYTGWFLHIELVLHSCAKPRSVVVHVRFWSSNWKHVIRGQLAKNLETCVGADMLEISWLIGLLTAPLASADLFSKNPLRPTMPVLQNILCLYPLLSTCIYYLLIFSFILFPHLSPWAGISKCRSHPWASPSFICAWHI